MNQTRKKILIHLHTPPIPVSGGDKRRLKGVLNYFRDRKEFFAADAVGRDGLHGITWTSENKQEVLKFVERIFIYEGDRDLFDFLYSRVQSLYYQKLLRQQLPIDSDYFTPPGYVKFVRNLLSERAYNFIWVNYIEAAHIAVDSKLPIRTLIDIHDLGCQARLVKKDVFPLKGLKFDYEANFVREVELLNKFDTVVVNSQQDMVVLGPHIPSHKLCLVPHLVEDEKSHSNSIPYSQRQFEYDLLFVGTGYRPNVDGMNFFLTSVFPIIISKKPDVRLALVGSISQFVQLDDFKENVVCLGYVADLSEPYLKSRMVICPLLDGVGTKVKLQEAMSYAIPIVTTTTGASGMSLTDGVNAFVTDEPNLFARQILRLLDAPQLARKISMETSITFANQYSNSAVYATLDKLFNISPSETSPNYEI